MGIDVLDMMDAVGDILSVCGDDGPVFDADLLREAAMDLGAIRDEQGIAGHDRLQERLDPRMPPTLPGLASRLDRRNRCRQPNDVV